MKKLKSLNIVFNTHDEFMSEGKEAVLTGKGLPELNESISFVSIELYRRLMTPNKLELLVAIARMKPASINQLAKLLKREFPHVHKDCRSLEFIGLIVLEDTANARKQLRPKLAFDYDLIWVKSELEEFFPISEAANKVLRASLAS